MFSRRTLVVWVGIVLLSGMFLMGQETWPPACMDNDGDGYGDPASATCTYPLWDCDDTNADVNPGATEICENEIDDDCDGLIDNGDSDCPVASTLVPDTGQDLCYDNTSVIPCPAPGQPFYGQDAQYVINAMSYTVSPDGLTVEDNVTGLMWQRCSAGLSGVDCRVGSAARMTWADAITYCNGLSLSGYTDWRLPNEYMLQSIVHYGRYGPAIDMTAFPGTISDWYWSSSTRADGSLDAWYVDFSDGDVQYVNKTSTYYVRCVR